MVEQVGRAIVAQRGEINASWPENHPTVAFISITDPSTGKAVHFSENKRDSQSHAPAAS